MTKEEKVIVSAFTGCLLCEPEELFKFASMKFGREIEAKDFVEPGFMEELKLKTKPDFMWVRSYTDPPKCHHKFDEITNVAGVEVDPCVYVEKEIHRHCKVTVMECSKCGHVELEWVPDDGYFEEEVKG